MSPTRRQVVCAVGTGAALPTTVATASAQQDDDQDEDQDDDRGEDQDEGTFSPEITINSNNLVATIGEREGENDPDTVTIQTADGSTHQFDGAAPDDWNAGEAFEVGYTNANQQDTRARIENWHGIIVKVTATKGDQSVSETNDNESSLEVSCSLWKTPDQPPTEFTALSEGASKQHVNRGDQDLSADQRQYGSPGRPLWTVAEEHPEFAMRVDFLECDPEAEKALWFDCTSVTVTEDELNQGGDRIEDVQLTFNDGTTEQPPGTADEADNGAYELPVTLSGSGDNEGKVLKKLQFRVDHGRFTYWNLEADGCSAEGGDGAGDGGEGGESTPESGDGTPDSGDGSSGTDGGSESEETATETPSEQGPSSDETGSTSTPEPTDDGSGSGSGSGGDGSGGSGGNSGGSEGASDDAYRDSARDTETPQTVDVGGGNGDASRSPSTDDAGTATASPATANGSAGGGNGTASGGAEPVTTEAVTSEDQPGMGFVSALGGLLGLGELARRRLGSEQSEAPEGSEVLDEDR